MKIDPVVRKETSTIALGVFVLTLIMLAVFAFVKQLDYSVFIGALLGAAVAVANFFLMALSVQKSAEKMNGAVIPRDEKTGEEGEEGEENENSLSPEAKEAKKFIQASYTGRLILLVIFCIIAVNVPFIHTVAFLIPLLFPRLAVFAIQLIRNKKEEKLK